MSSHTSRGSSCITDVTAEVPLSKTLSSFSRVVQTDPDIVCACALLEADSARCKSGSKHTRTHRGGKFVKDRRHRPVHTVQCVMVSYCITADNPQCIRYFVM